MYRQANIPTASAGVQRWYDSAEDSALDGAQPNCIASECELSYMLPQMLSPVESQAGEATSSALNWLLRALRARTAPPAAE